jgi:hypothetical protein
MEKKLTYRIRNWSEYNKALVQRGSITLWFSDEAIKGWQENKRTGKRGRPRVYSNDAILCALMIRAVYHMPLRALRGFLLSLANLMSLILPIPCYTRICRRAKEIGQELKKLSNRRPTDIVFDSSGVKVYGEGEWKVRQHGKSKRRTWRKIHLAVDPSSHEIILSELTESNKADASIANRMVPHLPKSVKNAYGDGAYDKQTYFKPCHSKGISCIVPPRRGGRLSNLKKKPWMENRNDALRAIKGLGGDDGARKLWKKLSGYHRRSLSETAVYRFKKIFGGEFRSRKMEYQRAELFYKSLAMNKMTRIGMPKGYWEMAA